MFHLAGVLLVDGDVIGQSKEPHGRWQAGASRRPLRCWYWGRSHSAQNTVWIVSGFSRFWSRHQIRILERAWPYWTHCHLLNRRDSCPQRTPQRPANGLQGPGFPPVGLDMDLLFLWNSILILGWSTTDDCVRWKIVSEENEAFQMKTSTTLSQ